MSATQQAYENKSLNICTERLEFLDKVIEGFIDSNYRHAIIVRAHRYGVPIYEGCFGKNTKPYGVKQDTISSFFSVSKTVIASLIMKLQEDALVDIVEPVHCYLPEFTGGGKENICVWHLLTHSSGIEDVHYRKYRENFEQKLLGLKYPEENAQEGQWDDFHKRLALKLGLPEDASRDEINWIFLKSYTPSHKPREIMSYSGVAFNLLGDILTKVTGMSIDQYARKVLFDPLGMTDSHFAVPEEKWPRILGRFEGTMGYPWINEKHNYINEHAQNGLKSTVIDLCRYGDMILGKGTLDGVRILSPASIREMLKNHNQNVGTDWDTWSLGWNLRGIKKDDAGILRSPNCVEHGGWAGHKILVDPEYGICSSVITGEWDPPGKNLFGHINNVIYSALD